MQSKRTWHRGRLGSIGVGLIGACLSGCAKEPNWVAEHPTVRLTSGSEIDVSECMWKLAIDGAKNRALFLPDMNAIYWLQPLPTNLPGAHFRVEGEFPKARYISFHNYDDAGRMIDVIADDELDPVEGSTNPFRGQAHREGVQARYALDLRDVPPSGRSSARPHNVIYGGYKHDGKPATSNQLVYRLYLAENQELKENAAHMPRVKYVVDDAALAPFHTKEGVCKNLPKSSIPADIVRKIDAKAVAQSPELLKNQTTGPTGFGENPPAWFVGSTPIGALLETFPERPLFNVLQSLLPTKGKAAGFYNAHSSYISAYLNPSLGQVAAIRFRAPKFPKTEAGEMPSATDEVRYWSLCVHQMKAFIYVLECKHDSEVGVDEKGFVTFTFSAPNHRPKNADGSPYANWLPYGSTMPYVLYRHMKVNPAYPHSPQWYKGDHPYDSKAIREHMGPDDYPTSKYCTTAEFERNHCEL